MGQTNSDKQNIHSKHLPAIHEVIITHNYLSVMTDNIAIQYLCDIISDDLSNLEIHLITFLFLCFHGRLSKAV